VGAALDAFAEWLSVTSEVLTFFRRKADDYDRWLAGMRRLQARLA
jgi:hypothetical protein